MREIEIKSEKERAREMKEHARKKKRETPCCCTFGTQQYPVTRGYRPRLLTHPHSIPTLVRLSGNEILSGLETVVGAVCLQCHKLVSELQQAPLSPAF